MIRPDQFAQCGRLRLTVLAMVILACFGAAGHAADSNDANALYIAPEVWVANSNFCLGNCNLVCLAPLGGLTYPMRP